jgi:hypothetical protein
MRSMIVIILLFGTTIVNAATVIVDFNELAAVFPASTIDSKGFRFTSGAAGIGVGTNWGTVGTVGLAMSGDGTTMELLADGTFSLESFDMRTFSGSDSNIVVTGYLESGGQISTSLTITGSYAADYDFSDAWQGLVSVQFDTVGAVYTDNIVTNVVPVPAAAWLFGSALAGLGWMRRKQTV